MLLANKNVIDKHFLDNWHSTAIAFDMENFTMPSTKKWVSVQLIVYDRELIGIAPQHGRKLDWGLIRVRCYDTSVTKSYLLANEIQNFLECTTLADGSMVDLGIADAESGVPLDNGVFETTLNFVIKKYN